MRPSAKIRRASTTPSSPSGRSSASAPSSSSSTSSNSASTYASGAGRADQRRVAARAEQQADRVREDRLARAGLAGDRVQAGASSSSASRIRTRLLIRRCRSIEVCSSEGAGASRCRRRASASRAPRSCRPASASRGAWSSSGRKGAPLRDDQPVGLVRAEASDEPAVTVGCLPPERGEQRERRRSRPGSGAGRARRAGPPACRRGSPAAPAADRRRSLVPMSCRAVHRAAVRADLRSDFGSGASSARSTPWSATRYGVEKSTFALACGGDRDLREREVPRLVRRARRAVRTRARARTGPGRSRAASRARGSGRSRSRAPRTTFVPWTAPTSKPGSPRLTPTTSTPGVVGRRLGATADGGQEQDASRDGSASELRLS